MVWDNIDTLSSNLLRDEISAVKKKWNSQTEVMKDAWKEFKEFIEDPENLLADGEVEPTVMWTELDEDGFEDVLEKGTKMSLEEKRNAEAVSHLVPCN